MSHKILIADGLAAEGIAKLKEIENIELLEFAGELVVACVRYLGFRQDVVPVAVILELGPQFLRADTCAGVVGLFLFQRGLHDRSLAGLVVGRQS